MFFRHCLAVREGVGGERQVFCLLLRDGEENPAADLPGAARIPRRFTHRPDAAWGTGLRSY